MRILIATVPHVAHLYIVVPYAQALQNAGHEVCIATPPGGETPAVEAGLPAVTFGEQVPLSLQNWKKYGHLPSQEVRERFAQAFGFDRAERDHWDVYYQYYAFNARFFLQREPRADIDGLIGFARDWKPDLVLWEAWFPLGGVMARACGAAHARILIGPDYSGWALEQFARRGGPAVAEIGENPLVDAIRPVAERYGIGIDDDLLLGQRSIEPLPPALRLTTGVDTLPVRWIPYNGGAVKPEWLHRAPERPRVALSLGLSIRLWLSGGDPRVPKIMEAVEDLDVELVATLADNQLASTPKVPGNVRVVDYVPLAQLLPTCSAVIHHGSSGTFLTSVAAGVPQLIVNTDEDIRMIFSGEGEDIRVSNADRDADAWVTSGYVAERGAGLPIDHLTQSAGDIREAITAVLDDPSYREGAAALHKEWLAKPGPAEIIPELEQLVEARRRG
jgi:UDP:flavonoid glycosyltransferase YjiC (YdhE family)